MGKGNSCCNGPSSCAGTGQVFPEQHGINPAVLLSESRQHWQHLP